MAGEDAAEEREGIEEEHHAHTDAQPGKARKNGRGAPGKADHSHEHGHDDLGKGHEGKAGEVLGQEDALAAHRERPVEVGRPGGIQVAQHRHGGKEAVDQGKPDVGAGRTRHSGIIAVTRTAERGQSVDGQGK